MAKKKTRRTSTTPSAPATNTPKWEKFAFIAAIAVILMWLVAPALVPIPAAAKTILRIAAFVVIGLKLVAAIRGTSISEFFSDIFSRFRKDKDEDATSEERPAKPELNDPMKKKGLVWTFNGTEWVIEKDHSKDPVPAGKKYDAETNTFVDASAPVKPTSKPVDGARPAKPARSKDMQSNGLVWTWDGKNWIPDDDHSADAVPAGKFYDAETNTFVELGELFTDAQLQLIKQLVAAEVKKAVKP